MKIYRISPLTTLNKIAQKNWGVTGKKKLTLFLWENLETSLELLAYQYSLLKSNILRREGDTNSKLT
jgi:hypothetical protein